VADRHPDPMEMRVRDLIALLRLERPAVSLNTIEAIESAVEQAHTILSRDSVAAFPRERRHAREMKL
jgi:hypothetical protein